MHEYIQYASLQAYTYYVYYYYFFFIKFYIKEVILEPWKEGKAILIYLETSFFLRYTFEILPRYVFLLCVFLYLYTHVINIL